MQTDNILFKNFLYIIRSGAFDDSRPISMMSPFKWSKMVRLAQLHGFKLRQKGQHGGVLRVDAVVGLGAGMGRLALEDELLRDAAVAAAPGVEDDAL